MSKGPFYARVVKITEHDNLHKIVVQAPENLFTEVIRVFDCENFCLKEGDNIAYYLDEATSQDVFSNECDVVVLFKHNIGAKCKDDIPILKDWYYARKGERILELKKLPKIIDILFEISDYYRKHKNIAQKTLEILDITQDAEALDALFSMPPFMIYELFGDKVCLESYETVCSVSDNLRLETISNAFIPVQLADILVTMKTLGQNIDNPQNTEDLTNISFLAILHGEDPKSIQNFINSYRAKK